MTPPQEARSDGHGCPSAEEIGAFLEGNLSPARTSRLLEHFAACEDCYETYLGAESFLSQAGVSTQGGTPVPLAGSHGALDRESSKANDRSGPFRSQGRRQRWLLPLAAVLLIAVSFSVYRSLTTRPPMAATALVELSPAGEQRIRGLAWTGENFRSLNGPRAEYFEVPFRLGVQVVNLQAGLETENAELAVESTKRIRGLIDKSGGYLRLVDATYRESILKRMTSNSGPFQTESIQEDASRAEQEMEKILNPAFFDLGRWTAAGRFAAIAQDARFFSRREVRRFPAWLLRQKEEPIDPQVRSEVEAIGETLRRSPLADADYAELQRRYEAILEIYYPGPNPSDPL